MASYSVVFIDKNGNGITGKGVEGEIPVNTSKLVFYNTGVEFRDEWNILEDITWDDMYQGTGVESILYNGSKVSNGQEVDYHIGNGNIEITVGYEYIPPVNPGGSGEDNSQETPMIVTFNYYVDGKLVDDTTFEQIEMDMGRPIDDIWPRTLECYHIRFDKINPVEDSNPGTSSDTSYNSLEFTYIYEKNYGDVWPDTGTLNNYKLIHAFSDTYFSGENCVTINGIGYNPGESFTEKLIFNSVNTKTLEVNLYYTAVQVSTTVQSYNVDTYKYLDPDLWGYVYAQLGTRVFNDSFITTYSKIKYPVPLTSGNAVYCKAIAKDGFEFSKWVSTSSPISGIISITDYEKLNEKERREAVLALPAVESIDTDLPNTEIKLNGYRSNAITAVFKGLKNEVKLYKGLDFNGGDTYYIWGGDNQWKNSVNSDVDITIPTREGAKLLGWVEYEQPDDDTGGYPAITRSQYEEASIYKTPEEAFKVICSFKFNEKNIKGVICIDNPENPEDETTKAVLLSGVDGYTDRYGNWLTGNKTLYPLWLVEEYPIEYVSAGHKTLYVDEREQGGTVYELSPADYGLPLTYTICGDNEGKDIVFPALEKQPNIDEFPVYKSFDRWEPSEIKKFSKTGKQTITAYWVLDTFKITLEKNNNEANQSVKIEIGKSEFDKEINNPTTRTAYKSFEGWYTENDANTKNGTGILIIDKDGKLQQGVEGSTNSEGRWIKKEDTTVYAKWTPEEYTITYYIEGNEEDIERKYTIEDTIPDGYNLLSGTFESLSPEGYYLDGWYTNDNYSGSQVSVLEKGTTGDKTFYGIFKPLEYTIIYSNISSSSCDNYEALPVKHVNGGSTTLLIEPIVPSYKFLGWYTDEQFTNKITSIPPHYIDFSPIYLYAKLVLEEVPIYYKDSNGNDIDDSLFNGAHPTIHYYGETTTLVNAHKYGYSFEGWYNNIECTGEIITSLGAEEYNTDSITLYCKFIPNTITITWDPNGGTVSPPSSQYTYEGKAVEIPSPIRTGYAFNGWFTEKTGGTKITEIGTTNKPVKNITYYAQWDNGTGIKYTVKHYKQTLSGFYNTDPFQTDGHYGTTGDSVTPEVKNYTGFTSPTPKSVIIAADGSTVVEYYYTRNKYTISWDANGGEELTGDYTKGSVYFETPIVAPNDPIKEGYTFTEWISSVTEISGVPEIMPASDITFTASYYGNLDITTIPSVEVDFNLEAVEANKITTDKWINNIIGEPETTNFVHLCNFFNTNFGDTINGECVTGNDLENFFSTELDKCITQSKFIQIFSNSENISNGYIIEKNLTFNISTNNSTNLEFTVTPGDELSIPDYPNTNGFIMYYTMGSNPTLYKSYIPVNRNGCIKFSLENAFDSIVIHRIPLYYLDYMNACILPKITIQNNSKPHIIIRNTPIESQIIEGSDITEDESFPYVTFTAQEDNSSIGLEKLSTNQTMEYSTDTNTWNTFDKETNVSLNNGDKVYVRGVLSANNKNSDYTRFKMSGKIAASGNCNAIWNYQDLNAPLKTYCGCRMFHNCTSLTKAPELPATVLTSYCYFHMFHNCTSLTKAPELPATVLTSYCYSGMFNNCTSLTTAPELPATVLADHCYFNMFESCTSLTTAPELPAMALKTGCYSDMFKGCTSLTKAPELPATMLAKRCYYYMFWGCTSLTKAPELPATTLADYCYYYMFFGCTSLTTAPELPATTLAEECYVGMFQECTSLKVAPELPATMLAKSCYGFMFNSCTSLTTAPELPATTLVGKCYWFMFEGCTSLNYIMCLATDISAEDCTYGWVENVSSTGTFVKHPDMNNWTTGTSGIPNNWEVVS